MMLAEHPADRQEDESIAQSHVPQENSESGDSPSGRPMKKKFIRSPGQNHRQREHREPRKEIPESTIYADRPMMSLNELRRRSMQELYDMAEQHALDPLTSKGGRSDMVFLLSKMLLRHGQSMQVEGVLQLVDESNHNGYGFLRTPGSYQASADDVYVPSQTIKRFHLRTGDTVLGQLRSPRENERYLALVDIESINYHPPEKAATLIPYSDLTAEFPKEWLKLEQGDNSPADAIGRVLDMIAPIGKGQRSLIIAPPKAGKTTMLQRIAKSILANNPEVILIVLMVGERPEEVTDFIRNVPAEVIASTFDEMPASHVQKAELALAKGKRLANNGFDVVILLDSITRLARSYNAITPSSGKILTGGLDSNALQRPKKIFGAARKIAEGGSLTIIATALIETGSKMDEVILEEFGGTGNNDIRLSREMAQRHLFPAIDINASSTRRAELFLPQDYLKNAWILRKYLQNQDRTTALEFLLERMKNTKTNLELFQAMRSN